MLDLPTLFERHSGAKASRSQLAFFWMLLAKWLVGIVREASDFDTLD
jgi:hypothetical protein